MNDAETFPVHSDGPYIGRCLKHARRRRWGWRPRLRRPFEQPSMYRRPFADAGDLDPSNHTAPSDR
jgi:hypothetical protein